MITPSSLADELGSNLFYFHKTNENQKDAVYFPDENIIMALYELSEMKQTNAILHEKGHHCFGHNHLDCRSPMYNSKQEAEADYYVVEQRAEEWLSAYDWPPEQIDINCFLKYFELKSSLYDVADDIFRELLRRQAN